MSTKSRQTTFLRKWGTSPSTKSSRTVITEGLPPSPSTTYLAPKRRRFRVPLPPYSLRALVGKLSEQQRRSWSTSRPKTIAALQRRTLGSRRSSEDKHRNFPFETYLLFSFLQRLAFARTRPNSPPLHARIARYFPAVDLSSHLPGQTGPGSCTTSLLDHFILPKCHPSPLNTSPRREELRNW